MEPERPIEKLLRAFAKKRREQAGAPMELHSAMRRQLQDEVARRAAKPRSGGSLLSLFPGWRGRFVFAICFAGLLVLGLTLLPPLTRPKPATLASADLPRAPLAKKETTTPELQPPASTVASPVVVAERTRALQDKKPTPAEKIPAAPAQPALAGANREQIVPRAEAPKQANALQKTIDETDVSATTTVASAAPLRREAFDFKTDDVVTMTNGFGGVAGLNKDAVGTSSASVPSASPQKGFAGNGTALTANANTEEKLKSQIQSFASAPAGAAVAAGSKSEMTPVTQGISQAFNRTDFPVDRRRAVDAAKSPAPVLVSFRMEQHGNAMRVVDADGSVYTGAVQFAEPAASRVVAPPKNAPSLAGAFKANENSEAARNYFFRVAGTNRNLQQNVVFSGNLIPITNAPLAFDDGLASGAGGAQSETGTPSNLLLSNSRISGKAIIGDQKEIEVIATPAP